MDLSILSVFCSFLLIYLSKIPVAIAMAKSKSGYDNKSPRIQQASLEGWGARALAGHNNSFESFVGFSAAMAFAHFSHTDIQLMSSLGILFVLSRITYHGLYLVNWHVARSSVWGIGFAIICWLFIVSI